MKNGRTIALVLSITQIALLWATLGGSVSAAEKKVVRYEDFGAKGDGKTDDLGAIVKAHAHANQHGLPVRANDRATYYIGGKKMTATIQTDTDFGKAKFVVDDQTVEDRNSPIFRVTSKLTSAKVEGVTSLKKGQKNLGVKLSARSYVVVRNKHKKQYIRFGKNQNNGTAQNDVILVDANGDIDMTAPLIWDFEQVTEIEATPIDSERLTIQGGRFITIANAVRNDVKTFAKSGYYARNITISRSNVEVKGLTHHIKGEGEHGAPYRGFISIGGCAEVMVRDCVVTGHKTYWKASKIGGTVPMGTYDISLNRAISVSFVNCKQSNDIKDRTFWGIMGTNFCKKLLLDGCIFSRFDAHMGVTNPTIRNSTIGHMGILLIGHGTATIENTTCYSKRFIGLRPDFGSTWNGNIIIRNCTFVPLNKGACNVFTGRNNGEHDFGYTCYMPQELTIDGLQIKDAKGGKGPVLFSGFQPQNAKPKFPMVKPQEIILKNIKATSGKPLKLSDVPKLLDKVKVTK